MRKYSVSVILLVTCVHIISAKYEAGSHKYNENLTIDAKTRTIRSGRRTRVNIFGRRIPHYRRNPYHTIRALCRLYPKRYCITKHQNVTKVENRNVTKREASMEINDKITFNSTVLAPSMSKYDKVSERKNKFRRRAKHLLNLGSIVYGHAIHEGQFPGEHNRRVLRGKRDSIIHVESKNHTKAPSIELSLDSGIPKSVDEVLKEENSGNRLLNWKIEQKIDGEGDTVNSSGNNTADVKVFQFNVGPNGTLEQLQHFGPYTSFTVNTSDVEEFKPKPKFPSPLGLLRPRQKFGVLMDILMKHQSELTLDGSHNQKKKQKSQRNFTRKVKTETDSQAIVNSFSVNSGANVYQIILKEPVFYINDEQIKKIISTAKDERNQVERTETYEERPV